MHRLFVPCAVAAFISISLFFLAPAARASCGSSSCPIELRALDAAHPDRFTLDLSFQYIDQDQPMIGSRKARVGEIAAHHDEVRTINRLTTLQLVYAPVERLQLSVAVPYVSRGHQHIHNHQGEALTESWQFAGAGDLVVQARGRINDSLSLIGGVKVATGAKHEKNDEGEEAEVTIQPGSGSTDYVAGFSWHGGFVRDTALGGGMGHATRLPLFATATYRVNGNGTDRYRRGDEIQVNAGGEYPLAPRLDLAAQLNARLLDRDHPGNTGEDPGRTGGRFLYLSPGLDVTLTPGTSAYAFVQFPVYQHVNGIQLTAKRNLVFGVRWAVR
ncbi:MAG: hypothetical protein JWO56_798 [Acidobacteria bacterium]|nr:hypothetical protein [Acidobacteriota bacterium]